MEAAACPWLATDLGSAGEIGAAIPGAAAGLFLTPAAPMVPVVTGTALTAAEILAASIAVIWRLKVAGAPFHRALRVTPREGRVASTWAP